MRVRARVFACVGVFRTREGCLSSHVDRLAVVNPSSADNSLAM